MTSSLVVQIALYLAIVFGLFEFLRPRFFATRVSGIVDRYNRLDGFFKVGIWGTIAVFSFVLLVSGFEHCDEVGECKNKLLVLLESPPNELGDALAGVAGTLAFLWIIVTVLLQSRELASQREELRLTREEMEGQKKATQEMAGAMKVQAEIFLEEQQQRREERTASVLDALLDKFRDASIALAGRNEFYRWLIDADLRLVTTQNGQEASRSKYCEMDDPDEYLRAVRNSVRLARSNMQAFDDGLVDFDDVLFQASRSEMPELDVTQLVDLLNEVERISIDLSPDQRIRVEILEIAEILELLCEATEQPSKFYYVE
ncbi:hypothetical protein [Shimia thalassica]|uniref:hypothetical protein n=1 Tax=Shimia thalassica TaxID=1715693 RepID=UPI0026E2B44D|nr:hypothetical protein [Shimia thalassica]MDO6797603.1 hypothetical protein [Shimia thalassica]